MAKRITHLDVLGEVRRAQRILRRVEKYLKQVERDDLRRLKRAGADANARAAAAKDDDDLVQI